MMIRLLAFVAKNWPPHPLRQMGGHPALPCQLKGCHKGFKSDNFGLRWQGLMGMKFMSRVPSRFPTWWWVLQAAVQAPEVKTMARATGWSKERLGGIRTAAKERKLRMGADWSLRLRGADCMQFRLIGFTPCHSGPCAGVSRFMSTKTIDL